MKKNFLRIAAAAVLIAAVAFPGFAARGQADFTRFVALGDSYGAGVSNNSLNANHQQFSWPAIVARQAGAPDFQQPLVSFPGVGPELQLIDVIGYPPTIATAPGQGSPVNLTLPRPYNNLSIPGAIISDLFTLTGADAPTSTAKATAQFILRGKGTAVQQALAQQPTFIAIWIGGNNLLGAVLNGSTKFLDSTANFTAAYNKLLDDLIAGAPNAGMVVGTLPTRVAVAPYATAVAPVIINPATRTPVLDQTGKPIPYIYDAGNNTVAPLPPGSFVTLGAKDLLSKGAGIPPALKNIPPFNQLPLAGTPLPDAAVLTPDEVSAIEARALEFNQAITAAASARQIPVADISGLFDRVLNRREFVGPFSFTSDYLTGGFFSYDGFHLTDIGYTLFADEYIRAINNGYGTEIPFASVADFLQNNGAFFGFGESLDIEFSTEAATAIRDSLSPALKPAPRFRATRH